MKLTSVLPDNLWFDTSVFKEYVTEKTKHYSVFAYDEKDKKRICELYVESITDVEEKALAKKEGYSIQAIDDEQNVYDVTGENSKKRGQKLSLGKYRRAIKKMDKTRQRYDSLSKKLLDSTKKTIIRKRFTIAPFKHYWFISKEHNVVFPFRIKPSKVKNQPVLIYLHGGGCCGMDGVNPYSEYTNFGPSTKAKKHDCTVVLPQFPTNVFLMSESKSYLDAVKQLSEIVCEKYCSDKNRIYVYGGSFGGRLTWRSAYYYPDYYACAMPIMGALDTIGDIDYLRFKDIPLMVVHASDDVCVPIEYDDKAVEEIRKISEKVVYHRWEEYGHKMMPHFFKTVDWDEWMFQQSLEKR